MGIEMVTWVDYYLKIDSVMASTFFHIQHEFRHRKSQDWRTGAQAAMAPSGGWDDAVQKNLEAGFFNHSFCPIASEGPIFFLYLGGT